MAVISSGKKKWATARFDIECETDHCPEVLEFGIDDVKANPRSTPEDYARRDGRHEYQIECPSCSGKTTVGYAFTERDLIDDLTNKKD